MLISLVTLILTLEFLKGTESVLLEPVRQCVPTASVQGPCHVCVCSPEGVFHCRPRKCQSDIVGRSRAEQDCEPNIIFRQDNTFCTCSSDGFWLSDNCEETFLYLHPRARVPSQHLKTNIACSANSLYLIDCNICRCSVSSVIDITLCTNRHCTPGHKADSCLYGDILRLDYEICSCSDINYYIDRLCVKILNEVFQTLETNDIIKLDDIGRSWRRLQDLQKSVCDSDKVYFVDCNQCVCSDGHLVCTKNVCERNKKGDLRELKRNEIESLPELKSVIDAVCERANVTNEQGKLPEIKYGMKCTFGKTYKMDCNICRCGHTNNLLCTKTACLDPKNSKIVERNESKKLEHISKLEDIQDNTIDKRKRIRKIVRRENKRYLRTDTVGFPPLPPSRICLPGRIYQENCKRCYCKSNRNPVCSVENACNIPKVTRDLIPEDVRPPIRDKEFKNLPVLPHTASPCVPGTTYKVDCNPCICDEFQNLMCEKLLCISFADMHRAEAVKKSGLPCNSNNYAENDVLQSKCVECACNGTTYCEAKEGCVAETEVMTRAFGSRRNGSRLTFNYMTEKCIPNHIYKDNCNKCYCQQDQTLRCTQKTCLNYNQAVILEKQQQYLQEHGL